MRTELFELRITIEAETTGGEVTLHTAVDDVDSTLGQLARLPLPVMSRAAALIEKHLGDLPVPVYLYVEYHAGVEAREPGLPAPAR
mgnify:CR=1 FL=1